MTNCLLSVVNFGPCLVQFSLIFQYSKQKFEGPRDLGKYKISSDYWGNWPLPKLFNFFFKVVRNIDISNLEPKKIKCFLVMFSDVTFHLETFSINLTFTTLSLCIFTWKRHFRQCNVKSVDNISRRNENNGTATKKAPDFFWFLCRDFNISDIF